MKEIRKSKKGFTLMEMLIVVAIIAVLIAIAIPTMAASLHKARIAADLANARAYFAYLQTDYLTTGEYLPEIDHEWTENITDTIKYPDGVEVKLQAGCIAVSRPDEVNSKNVYGYQVFYQSNDGKTTQLFGDAG